jgi:creatine kinase
MPDLSRNFNLMADVLKNNSSIYDELKRVTTKTGVTLAKCIKTGVDNAGHPMIKTVGAVAGDAESYEAFKMFFDPLIKAAHRGSKFEEAGHSTNLDFTKVSDVVIDPLGGHVVSSRIRVQRNLMGLRMPPSCSRDERCEVERIVCRALEELSGRHEGNYYPLRGSTSCVTSPYGMSEEDQAMLDEEGLLFNEPDAALVLATGSGRDWPEARGVFRSTSGGVAAWVNEEDHLRLVLTDGSANLKAAFQRFCMVEAALRESIRQEGSDFARNTRLGYLSACPSNLGSGLRAEVTCRLPLLGQQPCFKAFCRRQRLQARGVAGRELGVWELVNIDRLGPSEVEQVDAVIKGARDLIALETRLEQGEQVDLSAVVVV